MFSIVDALMNMLPEEDIAKSSQFRLGKEYSVDASYVLGENIEPEFQQCLKVALKAFITYFSKSQELVKSRDRQLVDTKVDAIVGYLESSSVAEEISHLLDPGAAYFDRGKLVQEGHSMLLEHFDGLEPEVIWNAWGEFLKAFAFASRSASHLREFLRASYEAGSFKALSNIEDVLEKMGSAISEISSEELLAKQSIKEYIDELKGYKDWAVSYQTTMPV
jgi:hypothetical protein